MAFNFVHSDEPHHCHCCGEDFKGNYCPTCGQKATLGPITWSSVGKGVMDVWGMGGRSLPLTLWHLVRRPGQLIGAYISGKRQVSFPPVKMLVIVGVFFFVISWLLGVDSFGVENKPITSTGVRYFIDLVNQFLDNNANWALLFVLAFFIVPTWIVFRHAPQCTRHTLPQGFYIQVFVATQLLMLIGVFSTIDDLFHLSTEEDYTTIATISFITFLFVVDYKYIFGYSWWGTLWRVLVTITITTLVMRVTALLFFTLDDLCTQQNAQLTKRVSLVAKDVLAIALLCWATNLINRKAWRKLLRKPKKKS